MYIVSSASNYTTEILSRVDICLSNGSCQYHPIICAKLITNELIGVVCVDHIKVTVSFHISKLVIMLLM